MDLFCGSRRSSASLVLAGLALALAAPVAGAQKGAGPGTVVSQRKISATEGGLPDTLDDGDFFGLAIAGLGDLDGDGVEDLAVGAPGDTDGDDAYGRGAVWILFLASDGAVKSYAKIGRDQGGFTGALDAQDGFGSALARVGDLDGDGVTELAVGVPEDDDGGVGAGAVWLLFLRADGSVKAQQKLGAFDGGLGGGGLVGIDEADRFGWALCALGDLDGDGVRDLAVGMPGERVFEPGTDGYGAFRVLFLRPDGTVRAQQEIGDHLGGFGGDLGRPEAFGYALAPLGDLDGDGTIDLAVGANADADGAPNAGAVWIAFLRPDGTVKNERKISATQGGLGGGLELGEFFGSALAALGDLDGDGAPELAVGARSAYHSGARMWILSLADAGNVLAQAEITPADLGLLRHTSLGMSLATVGDLDGDGTVDLVSSDSPGSYSDNGGGTLTLFLAPDKSVRALRAINTDEDGFASTLDDRDAFGSSVADVGDLDGDGIRDLVVGAAADHDRDYDAGAVYVLFLDADGGVKARRKIGTGQGGFTEVLGHADRFGSTVAALGDLDGDGLPEIAVGAPAVAGEDAHAGSVWILFLRADGTVERAQQITSGTGGFIGDVEPYDAFGGALAALGDLDGDGVGDLAVGASGFYDTTGAIHVLFLASDGTVKAQHEIEPLEAGFAASPFTFGAPLANVGDLDGDGLPELATGSAYGGEEGQTTLSILFLRADGSVRARTEIAEGVGGFTGELDEYDGFPSALAALGDLDGDGVEDLAVGATGDDDGGNPTWAFQGWGAVWILFLRADGTVRAQQKISATAGGFGGHVLEDDRFGGSLANVGDRDGDGLVELAVGASGVDDGGRDRGALWLLALDGIATLDFEHGDDALRTELVDGQVLPGTAFTRTLSITSAGDNLGPTLFDSTPARGAGGSDPDLLVALGNLLVLQDPAQPAQSVLGIFDVPGDAPAGGVVTIDFRSAVEPRSLVLVDIDSELGQGVEVALVDERGRTRVYDVPAGWTGERRADRTSGFRTLDLTTLAPQPGFRSTARAHQHARFDARRVTTLRVRFARSGALDELRWDPHPALDELGAPVRMR